MFYLPYISEQELEVSVLDLFIAGSETSSTTIRYAFLFLAMHPHVQDKIGKEIDDLLPRDATPCMEHKEKYSLIICLFSWASAKRKEHKGRLTPPPRNLGNNINLRKKYTKIKIIMLFLSVSLFENFSADALDYFHY